jgi:hypothetical protein
MATCAGPAPAKHPIFETEPTRVPQSAVVVHQCSLFSRQIQVLGCGLVATSLRNAGHRTLPFLI